MTDLVPPNASRFVRAMVSATARAAAIEHPIATLIDPMAIEARWLPWLAWAFSVDRWDADWSEERKRQAVAEAIPAHRRKGTPASVDAVLADYDSLLHMVEWHEVTPRATPHTFDIVLPLGSEGGTRATARFAEAVARDVDQVKPARSHGTLIQQVPAACDCVLLTPYIAAANVQDDYFVQLAGDPAPQGFTAQYQSDDANGGLDGFDWLAIGR